VTCRSVATGYFVWNWAHIPILGRRFRNEK